MGVTLTNLIPDPINLTGWAMNPTNVTDTATIAGYGGGNFFNLAGTTSTKEKTVATKTGIELKSKSTYYARWYMYQETTDAAHKTQVYFPVAEPMFGEHIPMKEANQWQMYSAVNTREMFEDSTVQFRIDFDNEYIAGKAYASAPMLIDLTAAFGAGNEPNKEWCDKHIPFFAGTKTLSTFDLGLVDVTPSMTSNTTPAGYVASASSEVSVPREAWCGFDNISNTDQETRRWHSGPDLPQWLQMQFPEQRAVTAFSIKNCNDIHKGINEFELQGSNDGNGWTTLGSYTNVATRGVETLYSVTKPSLYRCYRVYITSSHNLLHSSGKYYCIIDQVRFYTSSCSLSGKSGGAWSAPKEVYAKVDGVWRLVLEADGKVGEEWNV